MTTKNNDRLPFRPLMTQSQLESYRAAGAGGVLPEGAEVKLIESGRGASDTMERQRILDEYYKTDRWRLYGVNDSVPHELTAATCPTINILRDTDLAD